MTTKQTPRRSSKSDSPVVANAIITQSALRHIIDLGNQAEREAKALRILYDSGATVEPGVLELVVDPHESIENWEKSCGPAGTSRGHDCIAVGVSITPRASL